MTSLQLVEVAVPSAPRLADQVRERLDVESPALALTAMAGTGLLLRTLVVLFSFRSIAAPTADYGQFGAEMGWVARSIASGAGFSSPFFPHTGPTALVPPLFPYVLASVFHWFGLYSAHSAFVILLFNSILSAITCIPIYFALRRSAGERTARLAGWLWAFYPFAIYFAGAQVWDYALTGFLFATCFCLAQRLHLRQNALAWLGFGALYGLTTLSNPSVLSVLPFFLALALFKVRRVGGPWLRFGALASLAFCAAVIPWTIRNYEVLHQASPVRDGFWLEFYAGNDGDTTASNPPSAHPATNPAEMQELETEGETTYLANKHLRAVHFVRTHPVAFAETSARRAVRFWTGFWSFNPQYLHAEPLDLPNIFFCTAVTLLMLRGLFTFWQESPNHALLYLLLLAIFPIVYYLTHSSMDYRQPIEPQIVSLVAIGIAGLKTRTTQARTTA